MRFREFIQQPLLEGGKALKGASQISQAEVQEITPALIKKIAATLKLPTSKVKLIGSAGKKPNPTDLSGDLDIAVECESKLVEDNLKELASLGKFKAMSGINVFSFAHELKTGYVQVDLMPVQNIKFAEWSYQANPIDLKQGLKGAQRNELFFAVAKHMPQEVLKKDDEGKPLEIKRYFYDLGNGLMTGTKSRMTKKGKVGKNFATTDKKVLTNDPVKVTELMFGKGVTPEQASTFDGTLEAIKNSKFPHKQKLEDILELAKTGIKNKGLTTPAQFN